MCEDRLTETILSKEVVYPGVILRLEHWQVRLPNGHQALREVACHIGASAVVALDEQQRVLLVRQMRIAVGRITQEIPAGKLDAPDEAPLLCAQRELSEETGYQADQWHELTCLETSPGCLTERIHLYLATGLHKGASHPDEDEFVDAAWMPLQEAVARVMDGTFRDGKTSLGILMAAQYVASH